MIYVPFSDNSQRFGRTKYFDRPQQSLQDIRFWTLKKPLRHRLGDVRTKDQGQQIKILEIWRHVCNQWSIGQDPQSRQPVAITILTSCFTRFCKLETDGQTRSVKIVITTGRECGSALWINKNLVFLLGSFAHPLDGARVAVLQRLHSKVRCVEFRHSNVGNCHFR